MAGKDSTDTITLVMIIFAMTSIFFQTCVSADCTANTDCDNDRTCHGDKCIDPCQFVKCGLNTICYTSNHWASCTCPIGFTWDPVSGCQRSECKENADCAGDRFCSRDKCLDPCQFITCGLSSVCHVTNHTTTCACPAGTIWNPTTGCHLSENSMKKKKFRKYNDMLRTWYDAMDHCISQGMTLATITKQQEQDTVYELITGVDKSHWIGGSDLGDTGNYTWRPTNSTISYTSWYPGEPDNYHYLNDNVDHCVLVDGFAHWWDRPCKYREYHVCEYYL